MKAVIARWEWTADGPMTGWAAPSGSVACPDLRDIPGCAMAGEYGRWPWNVFIFDDAATIPEDSYILGEGRFEEIRPSLAARTRWGECFGKTPEGDTLLDWYVWQMTDGSTPDGSAPCKPILPTHLLVAEFHLPKHSLAWSQKIRQLDRSNRYHNRILDVLIGDFDRLLIDVGNEREAIDKARKDSAKDNSGGQKEKEERAKKNAKLKQRDEALAELPGKVLRANADKYRIDPKQINKDVEPRQPTTTISDDFNRANGSLGANWTDTHGTWSIVSNAAYQSEGGFYSAHHNTSLSSTDHEASLVWSSVNRAGPMTRASNATSTNGYCALQSTSGPTWYNASFSANSLSALASGSGDYSGSVFTSIADGSSISMEVGGSNFSTVTNTTHISPVKCGMLSRTTYVDNFEAADLLAPTKSRIIGGGLI